MWGHEEICDEKVGHSTKWLGTTGLNDSASPKIVIRMCSNFFRFILKVLLTFECCRGDPYTTANRNFAHS